MTKPACEPLIRIEALSKSYFLSKSMRKPVRFFAMKDCTLEIRQGEILGLVGESGSGKSTLGKAMLRLIEPDSGMIWFEGKNIMNMKSQILRKERRHFQMIFQDPYASLNPQMTVSEILSEPFLVHEHLTTNERSNKVQECVRRVGLPFDALSRYPHQFSGGQRQRIGIARALALHPQLIVADEPVSALDVSIQAQIINLLLDLQEEYHLAYLFISHNLHLVQRIADRVAVMYFGKIIEIGIARELYRRPLHPYTKMLLSSASLFEAESEKEDKGKIDDATNLQTAKSSNGCAFRFRCHLYKTLSFEKKKCCDTIEPALTGDEDHVTACHAVID